MNKGYEAAKYKLQAARNRKKQEAMDKYYEKPKLCKNCNNAIAYEKRNNNDYFCSRTCSALYNSLSKKPKLDCKNCGKFLNKNAKQFCSKSCQQKFLSQYLTQMWLDGNSPSRKDGTVPVYIKRYLIKESQNKCQVCGWGGINPVSRKSVLQVHHIDGNSDNNLKQNLQILCPNCHSMTPTYGSLNIGRGRKNRYRK